MNTNTEGNSFKPATLMRDQEPNGALTAQKYLLEVATKADIHPDLVVFNHDIDRREAKETAPKTWGVVTSDGPCTKTAPRQRLETAWNFGKIQEESAQSLVSDFVTGSEKEQVFLWSDLIQKGPQVVPFLLAELQQAHHPETRCHIISALWETRDSRAVDPLLACLQDQHEKVRAYAACGLGWLQDVRAMPALVEMLNDPQIRVRWFAATALERFGGEAIDVLRVALRDQRPLVRVGAANILGWMMDSRSVDALIAALEDHNEEVRMQAAAALGWVRDVRAIAPIARLIEDKSEWTRYVAIQALADIGDQQVVEPLNAALNSPYSRVQEAADQALKRLADSRS